MDVKLRFVKESITDRDAVYKLFEEEHPDMVVNFCGSHVDRSIEIPEVFLNTNIKYCCLMDIFPQNTVSSVIIQVSTDEVYGDTPIRPPESFL